MVHVIIPGPGVFADEDSLYKSRQSKRRDEPAPQGPISPSFSVSLSLLLLLLPHVSSSPFGSSLPSSPKPNPPDSRFLLPNNFRPVRSLTSVPANCPRHTHQHPALTSGPPAVTSGQRFTRLRFQLGCSLRNHLGVRGVSIFTPSSTYFHSVRFYTASSPIISPLTFRRLNSHLSSVVHPSIHIHIQTYKQVTRPAMSGGFPFVSRQGPSSLRHLRHTSVRLSSRPDCCIPR